MRIAAFLPELLRHLFKKPATVDYPFKKTAVPKDFRGTPYLQPELCIVCKACERDCPAEAIVITEVNAAEKLFNMVIHNDRCVHCKQCVEVCPTGALLDREVWTESTKDAFLVPCRNACPAGANIPEYVRLVSLGRPEEAIEVSKCAYKSHGYTFFDDHIYYPERIVEHDEVSLYAEKSRFAVMAVYVVHASLLLIFLGLEPERIRVVELSHDEWSRVPQVLPEHLTPQPGHSRKPFLHRKTPQNLGPCSTFVRPILPGRPSSPYP